MLQRELTQNLSGHRGNSYTETSISQRELLHRNYQVTEGTLTQKPACCRGRTFTQNLSGHSGNSYTETSRLQRELLQKNSMLKRELLHRTYQVTEGTLKQKPACYRGNSYTETSMLQREILHRNQHVT